MDELAADRAEMVRLLESIGAPDGSHPSLVPGVTLLRSTYTTRPEPILFEPCIAIVAQGSKRYYLPDRVLVYGPLRFLTLTVPIPALCETTVDANRPFLGIAVRIDLATVSDLLITLGAATTPNVTSKDTDPRATAAPMNASLSRTALRLLECLRSAQDAECLGAQLVREVQYRVLCSEAGHALRNLVLAGSRQTPIHPILQRMHADYTATFKVPDLAREAGMSISALHSHFKEVTDQSPLQYLKTIRLHKAKMLMVQESIGAAIAADRVGYDSPSQFSREFKRMFGKSPTDEAQNVRAGFGLAEAI